MWDSHQSEPGRLEGLQMGEITVRADSVALPLL